MQADRQDEEARRAELESKPPADYAVTEQEVREELQKHKYSPQQDQIHLEALLENESSQYLWYSPVPNLEAESE